MLAKLMQYINGIKAPDLVRAISTPLRHLANPMSSQCMTSAGLRIKGGSASAITQAHTAIYAIANGVLVTKAADTDMAALSGTVTNANFGGWAHYIDSAGTLTSLFLGQGATLAQVTFADQPLQKALIGLTLVNPTGTGNFVGGTTVLDDGTVVPNAVFINTQGAIDPTVLLGI
jgi:hypothetical protein